MEEDGFWDRNARYSYLVGCAWAGVIRAGTADLEQGQMRRPLPAGGGH